MRISDWSSDVCSSDLGRHPGALHPAGHRAGERYEGLRLSEIEMHALTPEHLRGFRSAGALAPIPDDQWGEAVAFVRRGEVLGIAGGWHSGGEIGRASGRERVCLYGSISVGAG